MKVFRIVKFNLKIFDEKYIYIYIYDDIYQSMNREASRGK